MSFNILTLYRRASLIGITATSLFAQGGLNEEEFTQKVAEYNQKIVETISNFNSDISVIDAQTNQAQVDLTAQIVVIEREGNTKEDRYKDQIDSLNTLIASEGAASKNRVDANMAQMDTHADDIDTLRTSLDAQLKEFNNKKDQMVMDNIKNQIEDSIATSDSSALTDSLGSCADWVEHRREKHHEKKHGTIHHKHLHKKHAKRYKRHHERFHSDMFDSTQFEAWCDKIEARKIKRLEHKNKRQQRKSEKTQKRFNKKLAKLNGKIARIEEKLMGLDLKLTEKITVNQDLISFEKEQLMARTSKLQQEIDLLIIKRKGLSSETSVLVTDAHTAFNTLYRNNTQAKTDIETATQVQIETFKSLLTSLVPDTGM